MAAILNILVLAFPAWVLIGSILALLYPPLFTWFTGTWITMGLGVIMLGMGITLKVEDFQEILKYPGRVFTGVALQYTIMPALGWSLGYAFHLPTPFAVGLVLVACCPGGTASNVISFLAEADVALSVTMTAVSTFIAVLMTPFLTTLLVGSRVEVDTLGLIVSAFQVVILPVAAGILLNRFLPKVARKITPAAPLAAVIMITMIVGSIIGAGKKDILNAGWQLLGSVLMLHVGGFLIGYILGKVFLKDEIVSRTVSIEVGMQNSGLGVVLARLNFANPVVAIPSAISSLTHCILGSIAAGIWRGDMELHAKGRNVPNSL